MVWIVCSRIVSYRIWKYSTVQYSTVTRATPRLEAATSYMPIAALALFYTSMAKPGEREKNKGKERKESKKKNRKEHRLHPS